ncbi:MAG: hypothetical protein LUF89_01810 [Ruminococcus sp.]|nr:hypothetical protein [Ruminococcus sp.]
MSVNTNSSIELQKEYTSTISSSEKENIPTSKAPFTITIHMQKQFYLMNPALHIVIVDTIS